MLCREMKRGKGLEITDRQWGALIDEVIRKVFSENVGEGVGQLTGERAS